MGRVLLGTVGAVVVLVLVVVEVMLVVEEMLEMVVVVLAVALDLPHSAQPAQLPSHVHFFVHG